MYTVDSGASLHMMGLSSSNDREKKTIRQPSKVLDIQTAKGIVVSDTQFKVYHWEDYATRLVILVRGRQEKLPDYLKV